MAILLDTDNTILIADNHADLTQQLLQLLAEEPDEETILKLAAAVLECDVLDIVLTHTSHT